MQLIFLLFLALTNASAFDADDIAPILGKIPVQSEGRTKPFDTFAKESLRLIHGKSSYNDQSAPVVVFTWFITPMEWYNTEIIEITRHDLKQNLGLSEKKYYSLNQIASASRLSLILQELENKKAQNERLNNYQKAVQRLDYQLTVFNNILSANIPIVPSGAGDWVPIMAADIDTYRAFEKIVTGFSKYLNKEETYENIETYVDEFILKASEKSKSYPSDAVIWAELHYNSFHPFRWSYICYLLAGILFLISFSKVNKYMPKFAWSFLALGFLFNTYGFLLRIYLTERPPVSNMYESVVWVAWGSVFFAMIFEWFKRTNVFVFAASLVSVICLITADIAPVVLDASLQPLQPVLRSNLWLIVHVMTITLGYSAFFLSFILSDIGLWFYIKGKPKKAKDIAVFAYRATGLGVVLLVSGTILGGVWADYSWGRFWGWDPKETWALIAILGYAAVLHSRLVGWVKHFGFLVYNSLCFLLIIMAWYGVNYILGAGLHSYGFGGGGIEYVSGFIALQLVFLSFVLVSVSSK